MKWPALIETNVIIFFPSYTHTHIHTCIHIHTHHTHTLHTHTHTHTHTLHTHRWKVRHIRDNCDLNDITLFIAQVANRPVPAMKDVPKLIMQDVYKISPPLPQTHNPNIKMTPHITTNLTPTNPPGLAKTPPPIVQAECSTHHCNGYEGHADPEAQGTSVSSTQQTDFEDNNMQFVHLDCDSTASSSTDHEYTQTGYHDRSRTSCYISAYNFQ